jgi:hypothetical protein
VAEISLVISRSVVIVVLLCRTVAVLLGSGVLVGGIVLICPGIGFVLILLNQGPEVLLGRQAVRQALSRACQRMVDMGNTSGVLESADTCLVACTAKNRKRRGSRR